MKNKHIKVVGVAVLAALAINNAKAVPITGNIGFDGTAILNSGSAQTATEVVSWLSTEVGTSSGSFSSIPKGTAVALASPWLFNSGVLNNFWTVGGFTFDLASSSVFSQAGGFLNVTMNGTIKGNGYDPTVFNGTFQVSNPSANGATQFTERLSFNPPNLVPDGANTLILLGLTTLGLVLVNRKYRHVLVMSQKTSIA